MNYIIEHAKFVVDNAEHININEDAIFEFCRGYEPQNIDLKSILDFKTKELSQEEQLAYEFIECSITFSTWSDQKWSVEYQGKEITKGSSAMAAAIYRALDEDCTILDANFLSTLSFDNFKHIFRGKHELPLLKERHSNLVNLGKKILGTYSGSFANYVKASHYDAKKLLGMLVSDFEFFRDEFEYRGEKIYFYKLAQLLVQKIMTVLDDKEFTNTDIFTGLADYKIPYILHSFNILEYDPILTQKIQDKEELDSGSYEEIEIRAAMLMAVNLIHFVLKNDFPEITLQEVNNYLWTQSNNVSKDALPHHRTRSTYY